jgi:hypothetical protein
MEIFFCLLKTLVCLEFEHFNVGLFFHCFFFLLLFFHFGLNVSMLNFLFTCLPTVFSCVGHDKTGYNNHQHSPHQAWVPDSHVSAVNEILPALDLFLQVIKSDLPDLSPPHDFCLRLLVLTLEFVHGLLQDGMVRLSRLGRTETELAEKADLDLALDGLMQYMSKLRDVVAANDSKQKRLRRAVTMRSAGSRSLGSDVSDSEALDSVSVGTDSVDAHSFGIPETEVMIPEVRLYACILSSSVVKAF